MIDNANLEKEVAKAFAAKQAWDNHVEPFFIKKELELFQAFKDIAITSEKDVLLIKMQANVLAMLKDEFDSAINTGKLASKQLEDIAKENDNEHAS